MFTILYYLYYLIILIFYGVEEAERRKEMYSNMRENCVMRVDLMEKEYQAVVKKKFPDKKKKIFLYIYMTDKMGDEYFTYCANHTMKALYDKVDKNDSIYKKKDESLIHLYRNGEKIGEYKF